MLYKKLVASVTKMLDHYNFNEFLRENLKLKREFREIDVKNPNKFINTLFSEVE